MSSIISVQNLGKKYILSHQSPERYTALRDVIANSAKRTLKKFQHPFAAAEGDETHEEFWALKDVTFDIQQGDRVGIIGRNGAGKSTLLKVLSRIIEPTTGQVKIRGRVASLLEVGTGFHPELTGRENIYLNGAILGMSKAEIRKKFDEIVAFAEVEKFLDTPVKRYSSGMYVRLAFAVAAHLEPEILIVDEVLAVGDAQFQKKCLGKMEEVGKDGRTVLFVSHNMSAIQSLCTKAIQMRDGVFLGQGNVTDQIGNYLKSTQKKNTIGYGSNIKCGPDIQVMRFEFSPNPVESKGSICFVLELLAKRTVNISALVILIYSALGERIAILDLRKEDGGYGLTDETPLVIEGKIRSFSLVEGNYSVGLYVDYGVFQDNVLGLIDLIVSSPVENSNFAPFSPSVRGVVELDFSIVK